MVNSAYNFSFYFFSSTILHIHNFETTNVFLLKKRANCGKSYDFDDFAWLRQFVFQLMKKIFVVFSREFTRIFQLSACGPLSVYPGFMMIFIQDCCSSAD
jgi:hypothetical protein